MDIYYIISNRGFLKQYYSEQFTKEQDQSTDNAYFADNLRYAKMFDTAEDANKVIIDKELKNCVVVNQAGQTF